MAPGSMQYVDEEKKIFPMLHLCRDSELEAKEAPTSKKARVQKKVKKKVGKLKERLKQFGRSEDGRRRRSSK